MLEKNCFVFRFTEELLKSSFAKHFSVSMLERFVFEIAKFNGSHLANKKLVDDKNGALLAGLDNSLK